MEDELKQHIKNLLEILDSGHIRRAESSARIHGYELDKPTSHHYRRMIDAAREAVTE